MIDVLLPWPISTNNLWRIARGRNILSARYKEWINEARLALTNQKARKVVGPIRVAITLFPPNRRVYDPDNKIKGILDLMVNCGLIDGDDASTVKEINLETRECDTKMSGAWVCISQTTEAKSEDISNLPRV